MTLRRQFNLLLAAVVAVPVLCVSLGPLYHWTHSPERVALEKCYRLRDNQAKPFSKRDWKRLEKHLSRLPADIETAVIFADSEDDSPPAAEGRSGDEDPYDPEFARLPRSSSAGGQSGKEVVVLISTMDMLSDGAEIKPDSLAREILKTSGKYFYQLSSMSVDGAEIDSSSLHPARSGTGASRITGNKKGASRPHDGKGGKRLYILTRAARSGKRREGNLLWLRLYVPLCIFIAVILYLVLRLSRTIFYSISVLEEKTHLIANGDLNVALISQTEGGAKQSNEITSLTENLERMRLSLSDLKERRTRFIMGISHDLRTPISVIKGYAEAITDGVVSTAEEVGNAAAIISGKAGQLDSMIEELISFVKLDSRDWRKSLESVPLRQALEDFASEALSAGTVFFRNVKIRIEVPDVMVKMDRRMFTRMMENLFSNAIRYSRDGDDIQINAYKVADECRIEMCDTGIGIETDELERIFDMFQRGTHSRREDGMGIGLAVVKSVASAHGWKISVRSAIGKGTTFTISIPI